jgi:predicted transcriptional regulator
MEKTTVITNSKCVSVALFIQHAKRMRRIIMPSVAYLAVPYPSIMNNTRHNFFKKLTDYKMCAVTFSATFFWSISHCEKTSATYYHKCTYIFT